MTAAESREQEQQKFLKTYWDCLMIGDMENFAPIVGENCVVHYPGNHFLSGDHVGREAIVKLYSNLYKLGIEQGTFIGELHDTTTSREHACALVKYRIIVGKGMEIPGEAIGLFHIENGQMVEYWLLERDQKMINDIMKISGKAALAGGSKLQMALGALKQPAPLARTIRRVLRVKRGNTNKML
ncbi:MAG TPA: nuclear transport factor 2 family protein [Solirubrobacter sp.]